MPNRPRNSVASITPVERKNIINVTIALLRDRLALGLTPLVHLSSENITTGEQHLTEPYDLEFFVKPLEGDEDSEFMDTLSVASAVAICIEKVLGKKSGSQFILKQNHVRNICNDVVSAINALLSQDINETTTEQLETYLLTDYRDNTERLEEIMNPELPDLIQDYLRSEDLEDRESLFDELCQLLNEYRSIDLTNNQYQTLWDLPLETFLNGEEEDDDEWDGNNYTMDDDEDPQYWGDNDDYSLRGDFDAKNDDTGGVIDFFDDDDSVDLGVKREHPIPLSVAERFFLPYIPSYLADNDDIMGETYYWYIAGPQTSADISEDADEKAHMIEGLLMRKRLILIYGQNAETKILKKLGKNKQDLYDEKIEKLIYEIDELEKQHGRLEDTTEKSAEDPSNEGDVIVENEDALVKKIESEVKAVNVWLKSTLLGEHDSVDINTAVRALIASIETNLQKLAQIPDRVSSVGLFEFIHHAPKLSTQCSISTESLYSYDANQFLTQAISLGQTRAEKELWELLPPDSTFLLLPQRHVSKPVDMHTLGEELFSVPVQAEYFDTFLAHFEQKILLKIWSYTQIIGSSGDLGDIEFTIALANYLAEIRDYDFLLRRLKREVNGVHDPLHDIRDLDDDRIEWQRIRLRELRKFYGQNITPEQKGHILERINTINKTLYVLILQEAHHPDKTHRHHTAEFASPYSAAEMKLLKYVPSDTRNDHSDVFASSWSYPRKPSAVVNKPREARWFADCLLSRKYLILFFAKQTLLAMNADGIAATAEEAKLIEELAGEIDALTIPMPAEENDINAREEATITLIEKNTASIRAVDRYIADLDAIFAGVDVVNIWQALKLFTGISLELQTLRKNANGTVGLAGREIFIESARKILSFIDQCEKNDLVKIPNNNPNYSIVQDVIQKLKNLCENLSNDGFQKKSLRLRDLLGKSPKKKKKK